MSVLHVMGRPREVFNVENRKHRELFSQFVRTNKWSHCPVRFVASEPTEVDVNTMARQMIEFYSRKEFGEKTVKKA